MSAETKAGPPGPGNGGRAGGAARGEFWDGVRAEAPLLVGVVPFGLIFGALAMGAGLSPAAGQAMSSVVFAGSAQFIAAQLLGAGASGLIVVLVVFVVNLRHALYSASVAPYLKSRPTGWKALLSYLLTDEAYAVTITHYTTRADTGHAHWFFLGAGLTLWTSWQLSTAAGIFVGAAIPADWPLSFALPLTFIALVVPALKDLPGAAAAITAGIIGVLAAGLPLKTGLLIASFIGILVGMASEAARK